MTNGNLRHTINTSPVSMTTFSEAYPSPLLNPTVFQRAAQKTISESILFSIVDVRVISMFYRRWLAL
jgi:hypothetical protein